jgi:hypothetical protein
MPKKHRKTFACGHRGYGKTCQRCAEAQKALLQQQAEQERQHQAKQQEKQAWQASFAHDSIDLTSLMPPLVLKARSILDGLDQGRDYREFGGKRLNYDRTIISIPLNRDYRMICHDINGKPVPNCVLSHEAYNRTKPGS